MNIDKKREYIEQTYHILVTEGMDGLKIRKLANAVGCTSAVLYKHFNDLEHLIVLASVRFLKPYIDEFREMTKQYHNPVESNLLLWDCFARHAFLNLSIFENMFFGKYKERLGDTIYEYHQLFPEELKDFDGFSVSILFSGDLEEREYIMLRRGANMGLITMEGARLLSKIDIYMFHGMLLDYKDKYQKPGIAEKAAKECSELIRELYRNYCIQ